MGAGYAFFAHQTSWPSDLESDVKVTCDMGYLCANFSLPGPLCLELGLMYATNKQTDRRQTDVVIQKHRLMPPPCGGGGIKTIWRSSVIKIIDVFTYLLFVAAEIMADQQSSSGLDTNSVDLSFGMFAAYCCFTS